MNETPEQRREQILAWLQTSQTVAIEDLVSRLGVSAMTVHRDLDLLAKENLVQKTYGAVSLLKASPQQSGTTTCQICHIDPPQRSQVKLQLKSGESLEACCPHCGLILINQVHPLASVLTRDFIYGRMVNAFQAAYVFGSKVELCCVPSLLAFSCFEDAENFVRGFGGQVLTFQEATEQLLAQHEHQH